MVTNATAPYMAAARQGGEILYYKSAPNGGGLIGTGTGIRSWFVRTSMDMFYYFSKPTNQTLQTFQQRRNAELRRMFRAALKKDYTGILTDADLQHFVTDGSKPLSAREIMDALQRADDHVRLCNMNSYDQLVKYIENWTPINLDKDNPSLFESNLTAFFKTFNIQLPDIEIPKNKAAVRLFLNIANQLSREATSRSQKVSLQWLIETSARRFKEHLADVQKHVSRLTEHTSAQRSFLQKILLHPSIVNIPVTERDLAMQLLTHKYRTEILPGWDSPDNELLRNTVQNQEENTPLDPNTIFEIFSSKDIEKRFLKVDESNLLPVLYRVSAENLIRQDKALQLEGLQRTLFLALTSPEWSRRPSSLDDFYRYTVLVEQDIETIARDYENYKDSLGRPTLSMRRVWNIIAQTDLPSNVSEANFAGCLVNHPLLTLIKLQRKDHSLFCLTAPPEPEQKPTEIQNQRMSRLPENQSDDLSLEDQNDELSLEEQQYPPQGLEIQSHTPIGIANQQFPAPQTTDTVQNESSKQNIYFADLLKIHSLKEPQSGDNLEHRDETDPLELTPSPHQHPFTKAPVEKPINAKNPGEDSIPTTPLTHTVESDENTKKNLETFPIEWIDTIPKYHKLPIETQAEQCEIVPAINAEQNTAFYTIPISENLKHSDWIDSLYHGDVTLDGNTCYIQCVLAALLEKKWGKDFLKSFCQISSKINAADPSKKERFLSITLRLHGQGNPNSFEFEYNKHDTNLLIPFFESVLAANFHRDRTEWGTPQEVLENLGLDYISLIESEEIAPELNRSMLLRPLSAKSPAEFSREGKAIVRHLKTLLMQEANALEQGGGKDQYFLTQIETLHKQMLLRLFNDSDTSPLLTQERFSTYQQSTAQFLQGHVKPDVDRFYAFLCESTEQAQKEKAYFTERGEKSKKAFLKQFKKEAINRDHNFIKSCIMDITSFITDESNLLKYNNNEAHNKNIRTFQENIESILLDNQKLFFGDSRILSNDKIKLLLGDIKIYLQKQPSIIPENPKEIRSFSSKLIKRTNIEILLKKRCKENHKIGMNHIILQLSQYHTQKINPMYDQFFQLYLSNLKFKQINTLLSHLGSQTLDFYRNLRKLYKSELAVLHQNFPNIMKTKLRNFISNGLEKDSPMVLFAGNHWMPLISTSPTYFICYSMQSSSDRRQIPREGFLEEMCLPLIQNYEDAAGTPVDIIQIKKPRTDIEKEK